MADFSASVKKILHEHGCFRVRPGKGDHEIWESPITKKRFPIDNMIVSRHTANGILKQAGISKAF